MPVSLLCILFLLFQRITTVAYSPIEIGIGGQPVYMYILKARCLKGGTVTIRVYTAYGLVISLDRDDLLA